MLIGILGNTGVNKTWSSINISKKYINYLAHWGYTPVVIDPAVEGVPLHEYQNTIIEKLDGLLLPGGVDISPIMYDTEVNGSLFSNVEHDMTQLLFLNKAINKIPILGICRGFQLLGTNAGLELIQDIGNVGGKEHQQTQDSSVSRNALSHKLFLEPELEFSKFFTGMDNVSIKIDKSVKKPFIFVNSLHHQGFSAYDAIQANDIQHIASSLAGYYKRKKEHIEWYLSEMFEFKNTRKRIVGVQFHPEEFIVSSLLHDMLPNNITKNLINAYLFSKCLLDYTFKQEEV